MRISFLFSFAFASLLFSSSLNISCIFLFYSPILSPRSWMFFQNHYSEFFWDGFPIFTSLSCFSGILSVPSSRIHTSAISFCLAFCVCDLCSVGCKIIFPPVSDFCPLVSVAGLRGLCRLPGGRDWCLPTVGGARSCPLVSKAVWRDQFRGSCGLRKTLINLSVMCRAVFLSSSSYSLRHLTIGTDRLLGGPRSWWQMAVLRRTHASE